MTGADDNPPLGSVDDEELAYGDDGDALICAHGVPYTDRCQACESDDDD
jgi:hypothetical protein